ncbi:MAG: Thioesterase superfamily [uncultured bacterium]|nr:MAG: Thioesterase superfamily [uncultured bacterium]
MITSKKKDFGKSHCNCIVCGKNNPYSWKMKFVTNENGKTHTTFRGNDTFQGYKGILHGGIITTLLDATMTHCLFDQGVVALTGDLRVRFLHPIPCNSIINLQAQIITTKKALYVVKAEAICQKKVMAWAEAKFAKIAKKSNKKIRNGSTTK